MPGQKPEMRAAAPSRGWLEALAQQPLDGWHASRPTPRGPQEQLVASGDAKTSSRAHAITTTIWSFVVTLAFGLGVVYPMKARGGTMDFFTGFLVEKRSRSTTSSSS